MLAPVDPRCAACGAAGVSFRTGFDIVPAGRSLRYTDGVEDFAAASTFGGRWRVTGPDGGAVLVLAPAGVDGSDDRLVVPLGGAPSAVLMRDRRCPGTWIAHEHRTRLLIHAIDDDAGGMALFGDDGTPFGRLREHGSMLSVSYMELAGGLGHCLGLALPLYFVVTGVLGAGQPALAAPGLRGVR